VLAIDTAIGRIVEALEQNGMLEKTLITMNSDHGMSAIESQNASMEPAAALRQAGFKVATTQEEIAEDTELVIIKGGVRLIYFRKALTPAQEKRVMTALSAIEGVEVLDRERLRELNCHPQLSGDVIVHPLPGYTIEGAGSIGGQHGRFTEANPVLFFHGPGIRKGVVVERSENVDIVPTILAVVGVTPDATVDGRPIQGALTR
jgi:arylsulfatase A-like enzyme